MAFFSTTGIRGLANKDMSPEFVLDLAKTFGTLLQGSGTVLIGRDTRTSSEMLKNSAIAGLLSTGVSVVDGGIMPIPVLSHMVREKYDAGLMITSSHNPPEYNGLKFILGEGMEISTEHENEFERIYKTRSFTATSWDKISTVTNEPVLKQYEADVCKHIDTKVIQTAALRIVVDPGNGAQSVLMPDLLESLGCSVVRIHAEPKGIFERKAEPRIDTLEALQKHVLSEKADLGVAFDIDGDRAIFYTEKGEFLMGDVTGTLLARNRVQQKNGAIITTIATSTVIDDVATDLGAKIIKTAVGAKYVGEEMQKNNAVFGFEENGGCVFPEISYTRDASFTTLKMIELLSKERRPFSELVAELPKYYQFKAQVTYPEGQEAQIMEKFKAQAQGRLVTVDGVKIVYDDGFTLVRISGTEPIIRIFCEAKTEASAKERLSTAKEQLQQCIQ